MSVYLALLRRPGAPVLALACALGWLGFSSAALAIVLLIEHESGSFARAGLAVGLFAAGAGVFAPLRGRLVDRLGAPVLVAFAAAQCALLLLVVWTASPVVAGLAGTVAPPLIATARTVWPRVAGPELTRAGHGLNALLGDIGTVLGPALTGAVVALAGPQVALAAFAGGPLLGALLVARHPATPRKHAGWASAARLARRRRRPSSSGPATGRECEPSGRASPFSPGLVTLLVADLTLGVSVGAVDVAAPALAGGAPGLAALPLSAMAAGSILGSLWAGQSQVSAARRFVAGVVAMAAVLATAALVTSSWSLAAVLLVAGAGYGVFNVGVFELLDVVVPEHRAVEALTWLTTAGALGTAVGAAAAGQLAHESPRSALILVAAATAPGAIFALGRRHTLTASPSTA